MSFTAYPTAPDINDPATFPSRATAWWAHHSGTFVPEMEAAMVSYGPGVPFCTVGGTADAITLTSGLNLASLGDGQMVRFRATAANSGATTISLDGLGAKTALTVTAASLPAGYIRLGTGSDAVETIGVYRSASDSFIVGRAPEIGTWYSGAGTFARYADGRYELDVEFDYGSSNWTTAAGSLFSSNASLTLTYPYAFTAGPKYQATGVRNTLGQVVGGSVYTAGTTSATVGGWASVSMDNTIAKRVSYEFRGKWY